MLSINTNTSSLIAQNSLKNSTSILNQAVERMTTGYKINHASDNAANYSIATNMTTKIGAYQVAEDNALQGLNMINTASENLSLIEDKLVRLRALAIQASNGTYGEQSLEAINAEAMAHIEEIKRLYTTSNYNGVNLTGAEQTKFIKDIKKRDTSEMTKLSSVEETAALASGMYSISTAEELAKLARMTNNGLINQNSEFVLANDINLKEWCATNGSWIPIGKGSQKFTAKFDGNGYEVSGLTITTSDMEYCGLFGRLLNAEIKNLGVNGEVRNLNNNAHTGLIAALCTDSNISNCYTSGSVYSNKFVAGIASYTYNSLISDCYSDAAIETSLDYGDPGGIAGFIRDNTVVESCYFNGKITGFNACGGIAGAGSDSKISGCVSSAKFNNANSTAGLIIGIPTGDMLISNCYSINSTLSSGGALVGEFSKDSKTLTLEDCAVLSGNTGLTNIFVNSITEYNNPIVVINNCSYNKCYENLNTTSTQRGVNENGTQILKTDIKPFDIDANGIVSGASKCITFQIGKDGSENSSLLINLGLNIDFQDIKNLDLSKLDNLSLMVSTKQTEYGAVQNRLESALEEISTQYENLVSSRSTIRDADIAEVSADYIRQQILQQASATLMSTANQSPSIALQLI